MNLDPIKLLDDIIDDLDKRARAAGDVEDGQAVLDLSNGLLVRYYAIKDALNPRPMSDEDADKATQQDIIASRRKQ